MNSIKITCFGGACSIGRSCILVEIAEKKVLLDCGFDFNANTITEQLPAFPSSLHVDLVLISHVHTDHITSLPYLTERLNINAPVYMTRATHDLMGIILFDFIKIQENAPYDNNAIQSCMSKIKTVEFFEPFVPISNFSVVAYPAGHILGACCFYFVGNSNSVLYTGDFSAVSDHHLSGYRIPRLFPDVLITESTYGNLSREALYLRNKGFVQMVHNCLEKGGQVLIPSIGGKMQELCLMLNDYWERMGLQYSIFHSGGMANDANRVYQNSVKWMNSTVQTAFFDYNQTFLELNHVLQFPKKQHPTGPFVLVASHGMMNKGLSYEIFVSQKFHADPKNLLIFPGFCGPHSFGRAVLTRGAEGRVIWKAGSSNVDLYVRCQVEKISFSAHADQFEILNMIERVRPKTVVAVHGDENTCCELAKTIETVNKISVCVPKMNEMISIDVPMNFPIKISRECLTFDFQSVKFQGVLTQDSIIPVSKTGQHKIAIKFRRHVKTNISQEEFYETLDRISGTLRYSQPDSFSANFLEGEIVISFTPKMKEIVSSLCLLIQTF